VKWVAIKCGDSDSYYLTGPGNLMYNWAQNYGGFSSVINQFHTAGIKVLGWHSIYSCKRWGTGLTEADVSNKILDLPGIDGLILDPENDPQGNPECYYDISGPGKGPTAEQFMNDVRNKHPSSYIAYDAYPIIDYHLWFPYVEFGKSCDAVMPLDYWREIGVTPTEMVNWMNAQWDKWETAWKNAGHADSVKPRLPVGSVNNVVDSGEITTFGNLINNQYTGMSLWEYSLMTNDDWAAYTLISSPCQGPGIPSLPSPSSGLSDVATNPTLAWSPVSGAASYDVQVCGDSGCSSVVRSNNPATNQWVVSPALNQGTQYWWRVRAKNSCKDGSWSDIWSFTTYQTCQAPSAPSLISPPNGDIGIDAYVLLDWSDVSGATSYDIQECSDSACSSVVRSVNVVGTSQYFNSPPLAYGTKYWWRVRANSPCIGSWSETRSFTTFCQAPSTPTLRNPPNGQPDVITTPTLEWSDTGTNSYDVQVCSDFFCSSVVGSSNPSTTHWIVSPTLNQGTTYWWRVRAKNSLCGDGTWSSPYRFTTAQSPIPPTGAISGYVYFSPDCSPFTPFLTPMPDHTVSLNGGDRIIGTDENGFYSFTNLPDGTYTVQEEIPLGDMVLTPTFELYTIQITNGDQYIHRDFVNCIQPVPVSVPEKPSELKQFKSDGVTEIGKQSQVYADTVVFKAKVHSSGTQKVRLQLELRRLDELDKKFDDTVEGLKNSEPVDPDQVATISVGDLWGGDYHWRVRTIDDHGQKSDWTFFSDYPTTNPDFTTYWTFAVITDLHVGYGYPEYGDIDYPNPSYANNPPNYPQEYYITKRLEDTTIKWINDHAGEDNGQYNIRFVVVLGDFADKAEKSEFLKAKEILNQLDVPYIPIIGNHDIWPYTEKPQDLPDNFDPSSRNLWNIENEWPSDDNADQYFNDNIWNNPVNFEKLKEKSIAIQRDQNQAQVIDNGLGSQLALLQNFAFDYKGIKFIGLDFVRRVHPWSPTSFSEITYEDTENWLVTNLNQANNQHVPLILLSHEILSTTSFFLDEYRFDHLTREINPFSSNILVNLAGHNHENSIDRSYFPFPLITTESVNRESSTWGWCKDCQTGNNIRLVVMKSKNFESYDTVHPIEQDTNRPPTSFFTFSENNPIINGRTNVKFTPYPWDPEKNENSLSFTWFFPVDRIVNTNNLEDTREDHYPIVHQFLSDGTYRIKLTTSNSRGIYSDFIRNIEVKGKKAWAITAHSPVYLRVTDPGGITIEKSTDQIGGMIYLTTDIDDDNNIEDTVAVTESVAGDYLVYVVPKEEALPTDTYSLTAQDDDTTISLADNVPISNIPNEPYSVHIQIDENNNVQINPNEGQVPVPEFPSIIMPLITLIGLVITIIYIKQSK